MLVLKQYANRCAELRKCYPDALGETIHHWAVADISHGSITKRQAVYKSVKRYGKNFADTQMEA